MANVDDGVVARIEEKHQVKKFDKSEFRLETNRFSNNNVSSDVKTALTDFSVSNSQSIPSLADATADNATIRSFSTHHYHYIEYPPTEVHQQTTRPQNAMPQVPSQQQQYKNHSCTCHDHQQVRYSEVECHCCSCMPSNLHPEKSAPFPEVPSSCCQSHFTMLPPASIDRSSFPQYQPDGRLAVSAIVHRQAGTNSNTADKSRGSLIDFRGLQKADSECTLQQQSQQSLLSHSYQALQSVAGERQTLNILDRSDSKYNLNDCNCDMECLCEPKKDETEADGGLSKPESAMECRWRRKQNKNKLNANCAEAIKNANDLAMMTADEITVSESDNNSSMKRQSKRKNRNLNSSSTKDAPKGSKKLNKCCKLYDETKDSQWQGNQLQSTHEYHRQHQYHYAALNPNEHYNCNQDQFCGCDKEDYIDCNCLKNHLDGYIDGEESGDGGVCNGECGNNNDAIEQRLNCHNHMNCNKSECRHKVNNNNNNSPPSNNRQVNEINNSRDGYEEGTNERPPLPPRPTPPLRNRHISPNIVGHRSTASAVGVKKYVIWCLICGGFSCLLGILFLGVYFLLHSYTITVGNFETVPTFVPAALLILTGLCIMSLARRKNRYSYLIKLSGACGLISALTCALVTVTTTVLHMSRLQALRECEYAQKTRTCTCYSDMIESQIDRVDKEGIRLVFDSLSDCGVVHGSLYSCLRAIFGLSVAGVLIAVFSCMLVYQLLSHERKKMYWEQLELRCRSLYTSQQGPTPHSLSLHAAGRLGAPNICRCCEQCHAHRQLQPTAYPWDDNGEPRFWTGQPPGNFYSPNPGGDDNLHVPVPTCRNGSTSANSRSRGITAGWSWPRMPWQRNSPDPNSRFRSGAPSSPDSQYGFSSSATPITPENVMVEEQAAAAAAAAAVAAAHAQAQAYNVVANNLPYGVWGPPPPYSDPNSPARRNYYQYIQPPSTCNTLNITTSANISGDQRQPNQLSLNSITPAVSEQHVSCLNHRSAFLDAQTTISGSASVVNGNDCCTQTASTRGSLKRHVNGYKSKGGNSVLANTDYDNILSDSDGGVGRDRFSNTLPTRKAKKRIDANAGVKSIGQHQTAQRVNVQHIFPNSSNCQNGNIEIISGNGSMEQQCTNIAANSNSNANCNSNNINNSLNNEMHNKNISDNNVVMNNDLTEAMIAIDSTNNNNNNNNNNTTPNTNNHTNRIESMLIGFQTSSSMSTRQQNRNNNGIENTAYQNGSECNMGNNSSAIIKNNNNCSNMNININNNSNNNNNNHQDDPTESEVYFADVSSCCNISLKNDNYYEDPISNNAHPDNNHDSINNNHNDNNFNSNSKNGNNNININNNGNSININNNNNNTNIDGNSNNHHSHHHHHHHHTHNHSSQQAQPQCNSKQQQQQQFLKSQHHHYHHMHQHINCNQHVSSNPNANMNDDYQEQQQQQHQHQTERFGCIRENSHNNRLPHTQGMVSAFDNSNLNRKNRIEEKINTNGVVHHKDNSLSESKSEFAKLSTMTGGTNRLMQTHFSTNDTSCNNNIINNNANNKINGQETNFVASFPYSSESLEAHRRSTKNIHEVMLVSEAHYEVIDDSLGGGVNCPVFTNIQLAPMSSPGLRQSHHVNAMSSQHQQRANNFGSCSSSSSIRSNKSRERLDMLWTTSTTTTTTTSNGDVSNANGTADRQRL